MMENSLSSLSESMQMYIVTIARLLKENNPVPLSRLADVFSISPVSVNEMCRKLQDSGLVNYQPYKGASLTTEGEETANSILRCHRLWEVFLTGKLGVELSEAHEIACQLEHVTSDLLVDRLDAFLDFPAVNPYGEPIPRHQQPGQMPSMISLDSLVPGQEAFIYQYEVDEQASLFLQSAGIRPGVRFQVVASTADSMLLMTDDGKHISLSRKMTKAIKTIETEERNKKYITSSSNGLLSNKEVSNVNDTYDVEQKKTSIKQVPLTKLQTQQRGIVVRVGGKGQIRQRMMDMGMVPGSEVEVVRVAPLGDPIEFCVKGYNLSLRKSEAQEIIVEVTE